MQLPCCSLCTGGCGAPTASVGYPDFLGSTTSANCEGANEKLNKAMASPLGASPARDANPGRAGAAGQPPIRAPIYPGLRGSLRTPNNNARMRPPKLNVCYCMHAIEHAPLYAPTLPHTPTSVCYSVPRPYATRSCHVDNAVQTWHG